jgi:hypothetical protein
MEKAILIETVGARAITAVFPSRPIAAQLAKAISEQGRRRLHRAAGGDAKLWHGWYGGQPICPPQKAQYCGFRKA